MSEQFKLQIAEAQQSYLTKYNINSNLLQSAKYIFVSHNTPFLNYFSQTATLPGVSTNPVLAPTPYSETWRHGDKMDFQELTITALIDEDLRVFEETYNWLKGLTYPHNGSEYEKQKRSGLYADMDLLFLTNSATDNLSIRFTNCHPIALGSLTMSSMDSPVSVITCDFTFRYDTFEIRR